VRVRVLGPCRIGPADAPVPVTLRKSRHVLPLLALAAPGALTVEALAAALWDDPPPSATKTVRAHVSGVRTALASATGGAVTITGGAAGYALAGPADEVDVLVLADRRRRARAAAAAGDGLAAATLLGEARRLWRGEPELPDTAVGRGERVRLAELRLTLAEDHAAAVLEAGHPADVVGPLDALVDAEPLRERAWALLLVALYRTGRQAEALRAYHRVRRTLADEVGVEPGPELQRLEAAILAHDPALAGPPPTPARVGPGGRRPPLTADVPRYAVVDGYHVAWGTYGDGPADLLMLVPGFIPVDAYLEEPRFAAALARLAEGRRVVALDRRGLGLSDPLPVTDPPSLADWVADAVAVLDAAGVDRIDVLANDETGLVALLLAATHPERVRALVLVNAYARFVAGTATPTACRPTRSTRCRRASSSRPASTC
jgi:DNA-binding SARP family transcriptional activator